MECPQCRTEIEPGFDACWRCGWGSSDENAAGQQEVADDRLPCLRCGIPLEFEGNFRFFEGNRWWWALGGIFLANREAFDVYKCPKCGKAEFYFPNYDRTNK